RRRPGPQAERLRPHAVRPAPDRPRRPGAARPRPGPRPHPARPGVRSTAPAARSSQMTTTTSTDRYIDAVPITKLFADRTYLRALAAPRVKTRAAPFAPRLLGVLEVSARDDGHFALLDGQHRWAAAMRAHPAGEDAHLVCQIQ